jgi:DNA-binding TFAR19-related protein (PDSD5 family)
MSKKVEKVLRKIIAEEVAKQVKTLIKEQQEQPEKEEQVSESLDKVLNKILTPAELTQLRPHIQGKSAQEVSNILATLIDHVLKDIKIADSTLKQAMRALNILVQKQDPEEGK